MSEKKKYKRRPGDKRDGRLIRGDELDTNHYIMPIVWPHRTDNEAFISETIDLTAVDEYLKEKNIDAPEGGYSLFMVLCAAMGKLFLNRPKMNRFYRNRRLYERYDVSIGFMVKKRLTDEGEEALGKVCIDPSDTFETLAEKIRNEINERRSEKMDKSSDDLRILMKFPRFVGDIVMGVVKWMDRHGPIPESISASDLFFNSIVVSHLGSIKLHAGYHHLSNWGTNSFFVTLGERKLRPFYDKDGNTEFKDSIDIGMTIDERIADGYYYSKSIRMMKRYLENPKCLDEVFKKEEE